MSEAVPDTFGLNFAAKAPLPVVMYAPVVVGKAVEPVWGMLYPVT